MKNIKTYEEFKAKTFKEFLDSGYIESKDLESEDLSIITCDGENLINLDGVEQFKNLEIFDCRINHITSLEPLKNLTKLEFLFCTDNKITSLKGVENLNNLKTLYCKGNPIDWVDYIDEQGNTWYIVLPKSIEWLTSDKFRDIKDYWEFMDKNQPAGVSRKFNF